MNTVSVTLNGELEAGRTYTVNIPVRATAEARHAANATEGDTVELPSNLYAELLCRWGDESETYEYLEQPAFTAAKQYFTVTVHYYYMFIEDFAAAPDAVLTIPCGQQYSIPSPEIEGFFASIPVVEGVMGEADAVYNVYYLGEFVWGDADLDGDCDWSDVTYAYHAMTGAVQLEPQGWINVNVYGTDPTSDPVDLSGIDGTLDFKDITAMVLLLSGE